MNHFHHLTGVTPVSKMSRAITASNTLSPATTFLYLSLHLSNRLPCPLPFLFTPLFTQTDRRPPRFFIPPFLRHISNIFFSYHFSLYMYLSVSSCNISNRLASEKSCLIVPQHYCCKRSNICMCCFGCSVNQ